MSDLAPFVVAVLHIYGEVVARWKDENDKLNVEIDQLKREKSKNERIQGGNFWDRWIPDSHK
jgi:hypothetical protein